MRVKKKRNSREERGNEAVRDSGRMRETGTETSKERGRFQRQKGGKMKEKQENSSGQLEGRAALLLPHS